MRRYDFNLAVWDQPAKVKYRQDCVIAPFYDFFGVRKIPENRYYWSICGNNTSDGRPEQHSEIAQMITEGIIKQGQFIGVDRSNEIIAANTAAWPQASWITGEFSEILHSRHNMLPMIIHADTTMMSSNADSIATDVISFVENAGSKTLVVLNTIVKRWVDKSPQNPLDLVEKFAKITLANGWSINHRIYEYHGGLRGSKAIMATFILFYDGRDRHESTTVGKKHEIL